jgi:hypothetical protein
MKTLGYTLPGIPGFYDILISGFYENITIPLKSYIKNEVF